MAMTGGMGISPLDGTGGWGGGILVGTTIGMEVSLLTGSVWNYCLCESTLHIIIYMFGYKCKYSSIVFSMPYFWFVFCYPIVCTHLRGTFPHHLSRHPCSQLHLSVVCLSRPPLWFPSWGGWNKWLNPSPFTVEDWSPHLPWSHSGQFGGRVFISSANQFGLLVRWVL